MTDKLVSRRDFLKTAAITLGGLAINPFRKKDSDPSEIVPESYIFKKDAFSPENLGFELVPSYKDRNTLKYTTVLKEPLKLNEIVKESNLADLPTDSPVIEINWIRDPITRQETSICTLENGKFIAFIGSANMVTHGQLFDFPDKNMSTDVLRDRCINIMHMNSYQDESGNKRIELLDDYYFYDTFALEIINPNLREFHHRYPNDPSDHQNVSTSDHRNEQFVKSANNRVYGVSVTGSFGTYKTSLLSWDGKHLTKVAEFPENEAAMYFDGDRNFPSVLCLDQGQLGFISLDRESPDFETNKFNMSIKIVDTHGLISKLNIKNPQQKYDLISDFNINIDAEMDEDHITNILSDNKSFKGNLKDVLGVFKIRKNDYSVQRDTAWIVVYRPNVVDEYKIEELEIPKEITDGIYNQNNRLRFDESGRA